MLRHDGPVSNMIDGRAGMELCLFRSMGNQRTYHREMREVIDLDGGQPAPAKLKRGGARQVAC